MFTYHQLVEICLRSNLDPNKAGNNIRAKSYPIGHDLFDLKAIDFPKYELNQIIKIGELIYNIFSQKQSNNIYRFNSPEYKRDKAIDKFIPTAEKSINFWLEEGLKKSKKPKNSLLIHNGKIYESNPEFEKTMEQMDKELMDFRRDFRRKQARSEQSARDFIITC